jgi:hypothetical protein
VAPPGIGLSKKDLLKRLRTFLGDTPEKNHLIPDQELTDDELNLAMDLCLDEYNHLPPFENHTFETFPSLILIIHGSAIQCLIMAGIVQQRNYLNFSDGGVNEVISDKGPAYQSWVQSLIAGYQQGAMNLKTSLNMERNFGVIPSPYGNSYDFDW